MLDLDKAADKERRLLQQKAKIESNLARLQKAQRDAARRDDTRRKIVLGGVILAAIQKGGIPEDAARKLIAKFASDRDKKVFQNFEFIVPETTIAGPPSVAQE